MSKSRVRWIDQGWGAIVNKLTKLNNVEVKAGVLGSDATKPHPLRDGNVTVGEVAMINEFGTTHVPERSFMRDVTRRSNAIGQFGTVSAKAVRAIVFNKQPIEVAMQILGAWGVAKIKENILSNTPPAQAETTIEIKGHARTLIDTETLLDSISSDVGNKESGGDED